MAGYLSEQGFCARSLRGGLVEWLARGGPVENGRRQ
jgi:rhodanese-related sulfurtransferase